VRKDPHNLSGKGVTVIIRDGANFNFWDSAPHLQEVGVEPKELEGRITSVGNGNFKSMSAMVEHLKTTTDPQWLVFTKSLDHTVAITCALVSASTNEEEGFAPQAKAITMSFLDRFNYKTFRTHIPFANISNHSYTMTALSKEELKWELTSECELVYSPRLFQSSVSAQNNGWPNVHPSIFDPYKYEAMLYTSLQFDKLAAEHPHHLMVFASGNDSVKADGEDAVSLLIRSEQDLEAAEKIVLQNGSFRYKISQTVSRWYDTVSSRYGITSWLNRNALIVGNLKDVRIQGDFELITGMTHSTSSCGPLLDGRISPTIVANGESVSTSVLSGSLDKWKDLKLVKAERDGTSLACPAVSGVCALLSEYILKDPLRWPKTGNVAVLLRTLTSVKSSFLKALLVHNATSPHQRVVHPQVGYGLVNLGACIQYLESGSSLTIVDDVRNGSGKTISIAAKDSSLPIIATMCYTDTGESDDIVLPRFFNTTFTAELQRKINPIKNRLRIHIESGDGKKHYPFFLDSVNVKRGERLGSNYVQRRFTSDGLRERNDLEVDATDANGSYHPFDTVKKIVVPTGNGSSGDYHVRISSSNFDAQEFVLLVSNATMRSS